MPLAVVPGAKAVIEPAKAVGVPALVRLTGRVDVLAGMTDVMLRVWVLVALPDEMTETTCEVMVEAGATDTPVGVDEVLALADPDAESEPDWDDAEADTLEDAAEDADADDEPWAAARAAERICGGEGGSASGGEGGNGEGLSSLPRY